LLWNVLAELERAYIDHGAGRPGMPSLDQWANLLRVLDHTGVESRTLPASLRLSKRAVRTRVSAAARNGWVEELKSGRGHATVRLTVRGSDAVARWKPLQQAAEKRWRAEAGAGQKNKLRGSLEEVVAMLPLEHPHYPASYGPADASVTGGNGQDWKAVSRQDGDAVSDLPFSALVSELLVAFAMNYEEKSPVALSLSANVIRRIPPEGRPLLELGCPVGVSALNRHGFLRVSGDRGNELVCLTQKGFVVSDAHEGRTQAVEAEWRNRFGSEAVAALRRALEDVAGVLIHARRPVR
jgi:hypothetical protein